MGHAPLDRPADLLSRPLPALRNVCGRAGLRPSACCPADNGRRFGSCHFEADPVANGLVASPARPGGNLTGFALWEYGFAAKWGELLREIAPRIARVGVIYDPANVMQRQLPDLERSLSPGVQLVALSVSSRSDLENAIERIAIEPKIST